MHVIDLDKLVDESPAMVRLFGRTVAVRPIGGTTLTRVLSASKLDHVADQYAAFVSAIPHICPDLTDDERERLTHQQVVSLITLSQGDVSTVEAFIAARQGDAGRGDGSGAVEASGPVGPTLTR
jgi:hypothetical protein